MGLRREVRFHAANEYSMKTFDSRAELQPIASDPLMTIEFFGTAGYHPSETRHTSCVFLPDAAPDAAFVLDAGTGFFRLIGRKLPSQLHVFLSHAHLDHTVGITFLLDLIYTAKCEVTLHAEQRVLDVVMQQFSNTALFPVALPINLAPISDDFEVAGVQIQTFSLQHPGGSTGYVFNFPNGKRLAYVTDTNGGGDYSSIIQNVDLLIHERNFSDDLQELAQRSGHCTSREVAEVLRATMPKQAVLTHLNPLTPDENLDVDHLRDEFPDVVFAQDLMTLEF